MMSTASTVDVQEREKLTAERLGGLHEAMKQEGLDAYFVPSVDEHINEYLPDNRQRRAWLTGFTGSAGDCLVGLGETRLFVDSRYHEQVDSEVAQPLITVSKLGTANAPSLDDTVKSWTQKAKAAGKKLRLGFDPRTLTIRQHETFQQAGQQAADTLELVSVDKNLIDPLWQDAPPIPCNPVFALPLTATGQSTADKLAAVRQRLAALQADILPITKLDQIAWLFNLRGSDIPYNPLFIAYALLEADKATLFTDASRLNTDTVAILQGIAEVRPYTDYAIMVPERVRGGKTVLVDARHTMQLTLELIRQGGGEVRRGDHPVELLKAVKNATELGAMETANLRASRGKIRAWRWLDAEIEAGRTVTETSFRDAIEAFYAEEPDFAGLSFNTIAGAGPNGSIVHYGAPNPNKRLELGELFLIDSGCQFYIGGTTDDTRTLLVGQQATELQKLRYTEVLKAHINVAMQRFPAGTEGTRLDGITRATLWQNAMDYGHGTGHGVGAFLNVHEGPNGIHRLASTPLEPGMITSIEPGFYEPGWGGIRLENLYQVVALSTDNGLTANQPASLGFESLTWVPFDKKLIDASRLSPQQQAWLNNHHQTILEKIGPTLNLDEAAWLKTVCS
jgi:Xaa-Pro aminopeptidase